MNIFFFPTWPFDAFTISDVTTSSLVHSAPFEESQAEEWKDQDELEFEEAQDEYDEDLPTPGGVSKALSGAYASRWLRTEV